MFDLNSGLRSVNQGSFPSGYAWTVLTAEQCVAQGLPMYAGSGYVVVKIPENYLQLTNGVFSGSLTVGVDAVTADKTLSLDYIAVAVDTPTKLPATPGTAENVDYLDSNNFAATPGSVQVNVNTVTSNPILTPTFGYENDNRVSHLGENGSNPVTFAIGGMSGGENLTGLTITFPLNSGFLIYDHSYLFSGALIDGDVRVEYYYNTGVLTITSISGTGDIAAAVRNKLTFIPGVKDSDADVNLTYSGTVLDVASGMVRGFTSKAATIIIDAVAQQPENADVSVAYAAGKTAAADTLSVTAKATFHDVADGSEKHYLLIEAKDYFDLTGKTLVQVAMNGTVPLTPLFDASGRITGWLNPDPASKTDQRVIPNPAETKNYIQIPVDDIIKAYIANPNMAQPVNGFTVSGNAQNGYTVTYATKIPIDTVKVSADFTDTVGTAGMAVESAATGAANGASGQEKYQYNNVSYDFAETNISVAIVETQAVSLLMGSASE